MGKFKRETYTVDGVKTVVHSAGSGEPVVFFHGAGTVDGFDFAESWADKISSLGKPLSKVICTSRILCGRSQSSWIHPGVSPAQ